MATLKDGARLGSYEIIRPLGSGGMGEVYLARDLRLDREVAIKTIAADFTGAPDRLERFMREAKTASSLNHPNIAHVYEIGEWNGLHYIVMEYVRGEALNRRIGPRGMPIADVIVFATQIADALDEAHAQGVIHRDLKPANTMITARRRVKLLDFGLAKILPASDEYDTASTMPGDTMAGLVLGTLSYMSPEQVRGFDVDRRSDIFSFGVMLYEMITGRLPFASASRTDIVYRITQVQPEPLTRYNYEVPSDLERIVRKCLEKEPDRRYQSVRELLVDLSSLRRDSGGVTLPAPATVAGNPRRMQGLIMAMLVLLAVAAIAGGLALRRDDVIDSIAVIPERLASAGQQATDVADGVAVTLANSLSQLPNLTVAPRQMLSAATAEQDPIERARLLGAHAVLTVRVLLRGDTATVSLVLTDVDHPRHVWGEQYSRQLGEIEIAQQRIAHEVAELLRVHSSTEGREAQDVFHLYQRGRYHANKRTPEDLRTAVASFEEALSKQRDYPQAHAGLALAYSAMAIYSVLAPGDAFPKAKDAARRALELNDRLADAHTALGVVHFRWDWNWAAAEAELTRAQVLDPLSAEPRHWAGVLLASMGRFDEALAHSRAAETLEPLSALYRSQSSWTLFMARRYEEAIKQAEAVAAVYPQLPQPHRNLGLSYTQLGRFDKAISAFEHAVLSAGAQPKLWKAELAHAHAAAGKRAEAMRIFSQLAADREASPYNLAVIAAGLRDIDGALTSLERALRQRDPMMVWAKVDPRLDLLREQPRFATLLSALRLD